MRTVTNFTRYVVCHHTCTLVMLGHVRETRTCTLDKDMSLLRPTIRTVVRCYMIGRYTSVSCLRRTVLASSQSSCSTSPSSLSNITFVDNFSSPSPAALARQTQGTSCIDLVLHSSTAVSHEAKNVRRLGTWVHLASLSPSPSGWIMLVPTKQPLALMACFSKDQRKMISAGCPRDYLQLYCQAVSRASTSTGSDWSAGRL